MARRVTPNGGARDSGTDRLPHTSSTTRERKAHTHVTVRQRIRVRRAGLVLSCIYTIVAAIVVMFVWNGGRGDQGTLAQASTFELLSLLGLFVVPPITFAVMIAEQRVSGRKRHAL